MYFCSQAKAGPDRYGHNQLNTLSQVLTAFFVENNLMFKFKCICTRLQNTKCNFETANCLKVNRKREVPSS